MSERHKDHVRGRRSVLDTGRVAGVKRSRPFRKIIPLLAFAFVIVMIAREEIPVFSNAWERTFEPEAWLAKQVCQKAALESIERREFARILESGEVNPTNDGLYIDQLLIGEMGLSGNEVSIEYSCYLDSEGALVKLNRIEEVSE